MIGYLGESIDYPKKEVQHLSLTAIRTVRIHSRWKLEERERGAVRQESWRG